VTPSGGAIQSCQAVGFKDFGGPEVMRPVVTAVRLAGPGEVRIRVEAAAINPADAIMRAGPHREHFKALRRPHILGLEGAGTIESLGEGVSRLIVGEQVMMSVNAVRPEGGAQAELVVLPSEAVVPIPAGASIAQASTLLMNALTAYDALELLDLPAGGTLMVTGGAGWLSAMTLGQARQRGIRTCADSDPSEFDLVKESGADRVVERGPNMVSQIRSLYPAGVDGVVDTAALGTATNAMIRDGGGRVVVRSGGIEGAERGIMIHHAKARRHYADLTVLNHLRDLASEGHLPMTVAETYRVGQIAEAHRRLEAGRIRGRLVLTL
jgi:NADPH:quinone reductase